MEKPKYLKIFDFQEISQYMEERCGVKFYAGGMSNNFGSWLADQHGDFSGQNCVIRMPVKEFYFESLDEPPEEWVLEIVRALDNEFGEFADEEGEIEVKYWW